MTHTTDHFQSNYNLCIWFSSTLMKLKTLYMSYQAEHLTERIIFLSQKKLSFSPEIKHFLSLYWAKVLFETIFVTKWILKLKQPYSDSCFYMETFELYVCISFAFAQRKKKEKYLITSGTKPWRYKVYSVFLGQS